MKHRQLIRRLCSLSILAGVYLINLQAGQAAETPPETNTADAGPKDTWGVLPLVVPIYTPETRLMVAGGGIFWFNTNPHLAKPKISELSTYFTASQNGQYSLALSADFHTYGERYRIIEEFEIYKQPNLYWGLGPDSRTANEHKYTPTGLKNKTSFLTKIFENTYAGALWNTQFDEIKSKPNSLLARSKIKGYRETEINGPGIHFVYDSRNRPFFTSTGQWFDAQYIISSEAFAGNGEFHQLRLDYRYFQPVIFDHVIAFNVLTTLTTANAPWQAYPKIGGQFQNRGYFAGRYTGAHMWSVQTDYRIPEIWWRFGLVLFSGLADVTHDITDPVSSKLKFSYGIGLRVLLDEAEKINLRLDLGFSIQGDTNFYFTFKEAF